MSPSSRTVTDEGFILHTRPYRNTSLLVETLTRRHGRITMVAKGARSPRSALFSLLQAFLPMQLRFAVRGEMPGLYQVEPLHSDYQITGDRLFCGLYMNELIIRLLHAHDPHPELYDQYRQCLSELDSAVPNDITLRYFEVDLFNQLGYGLNLVIDPDTQRPVLPDQRYAYIIERGPSEKISEQATLMISGDTLVGLASRALCTEVQRREAKQLTRAVIDYYLGQRQIKSRELYRHFR